MQYTKGFTLVELVIVISIVGLLASIILSSLNSARTTARDTAIKNEAVQYRNLLYLEYDNSKSFIKIQPNGSWNDCVTNFTGSYASQAMAICSNLVSLSNYGGNPAAGAGDNVAIGNSSSNVDKFSILVWLPGAQKYYCLGISGSSVGTPVNWLGLGCPNNP